MKLNKPVVITPGHIIGIITFMKAWKCEHPSILAASSNSDGIFWKKERINQIVKGWFIATRTAITANGFPNKVGAKSPIRGLKISDEFIKKGKYPATKIEWGNALKTNAITKIQNAKEDLYLARAKPASVPKVRETITTPEVTITEFQKYLKKSLSNHTVL